MKPACVLKLQIYKRKFMKKVGVSGMDDHAFIILDGSERVLGSFHYKTYCKYYAFLKET